VTGDAACAELTWFDPVTSTRSVAPVSAADGTYVFAVAPLIGAHVAPVESQRDHE